MNLHLSAYPEPDSHQGTLIGSTEEHIQLGTCSTQGSHPIDPLAQGPPPHPPDDKSSYYSRINYMKNTYNWALAVATQGSHPIDTNPQLAANSALQQPGYPTVQEP